MNSYFATIEQQANPRLHGKPVGVTGGDRESRTVLCTASVEAKKLGVKTGMMLWEAQKICPSITIVPGDSDKYLYCTTKIIDIFKSYTPFLEIFSIDEAFLELPDADINQAATISREIKARIKVEIGEWVTCSVGISYNKLLAKLAGGLQKPDGLVIIADQREALQILDQVELDEVCGIGPRIKQRLLNMGVRDFKTLRRVPEEYLLASFKSYGAILYNMARGIDETPVKPFYLKEEVKSVGHCHTLDRDTADPVDVKQILLKLCELVAYRLRRKQLKGKTIHLWYRSAFTPETAALRLFYDNGMQTTLNQSSSDGWIIFQAAWQIFRQIWDGGKIRMIGISVSGLLPGKPANVSWLPEDHRREILAQTMDKINGKFGDFTLHRGTLLQSVQIRRKPNPFLSDRRFKLL